MAVPAAAATLFLGGAGAFLAAPADAVAAPPPAPRVTPGHPTVPVAQLTGRVGNALKAAAKAAPKSPADNGRTATTAPAAPSSAGPSGTVDPKIIGGTTTAIGTAPWMAQLWYWDDRGTSDTGDDIGFFCGGTVISPTKILTAAHCVKGYDWHAHGSVLTGTAQTPTTDSAGTTDLHGGTASGVWRQWNDPSFDATTLDNDVAVLTLPNPVSAPTLKVTSAGDTASYRAGTQAQVYGWGRTTSTSQAVSTALRTATLPMNSDAICSAAFGGEYAPGHMVCAGNPATGQDAGTVAACNGDSGGPLVAGGRLVGVVSWGVEDCVAKGSFSVFTKVSSYLGRIEPRVDDADLNGDGLGDLFARTPAGTGYEYDSRRTGLNSRVPLGDWGGLTLVRQADLDRDGYQDFLTRDSGGTLYWEHFVPATGKWAVSRVGGGWNTMRFIAVPGDLTGDALPDLVAGDSSGNVWVYPGKGNGTFGARTKAGYGWNVYGANVVGRGDLTRDGRPDLLAQDASGNLWLHPGTGTTPAAFGARIKAGYGYHYTAYVAVGDLTGDGKADLVTRDPSGNLWLYRGTGSAKAPLAARTKLGYGWNVYDLFG
ncbi:MULTISPECIES: trypsin-like serine protease [Streptomycetaceae]|nr:MULTISPECIES: trypsin-like serine protease [Streptomycetaceae]